ncbi:hypothetical protein PoB_001934300 [Plakobranchus ocellatus]|uniref:Uncharacterized protein n=1 Tax=Plakobranchus ocellatus TaxID=259542 RepID=A0AAV3ZDL9_9GAST|nr:hypothetical protein PoB_001934300 [Plakobranchus ocellatus]
MGNLARYLSRDMSRVLGQNRGVGGTVTSESTLRSAGNPLSQVQVLRLTRWPDGGPESLRSRCCGLVAMYKNLDSRP